jgi:hypothetical protein
MPISYAYHTSKILAFGTSSSYRKSLVRFPVGSGFYFGEPAGKLLQPVGEFLQCHVISVLDGK